MRHVLVNDNTTDESSVFEFTTNFSFNLDEIKINITTIQIGNCKNSLDTNFSNVTQVVLSPLSSGTAP